MNFRRFAVSFSFRRLHKSNLGLFKTSVSGFSILVALCFATSVYAESNTIKVGVFDNHPIIFQQSPGQYAGLSIDLLESIATEENLSFEYVHGEWKDVLTKLEAGEIDLLVGIAYKPERAEKFDFTRETLINNWGVIYRNPSSKITSLEDLEGKRVALMPRSIHSKVFAQLMGKFQFEFEMVEAQNYLDALKKVEDGSADAAVINRVISLLNASKFEIIETGIIFNPVEVRFAAPKGQGSNILRIIDANLEKQKQDTNSPYHTSLNKWLKSQASQDIPEWIKYVVGGAILILFIMMINIYLIRRQVSVRTQELSESESRFRQLAENIKEVFWIGSPDWQSVYYVSPAYEVIWGRTRESLYKNPLQWLESVHDDDKECVLADMDKKAAGNLTDPAFPEYRVISNTGDIHWILARAYPIHDNFGNVTRIVGIAEDITNRKQAEERINFMAHHDPLTRLANRYAFEKKLLDLVNNKEPEQGQHALLYIDLDQFKIVNDTCGHSAGDKMLSRLAKLLEETVGSKGIIARLGGDEFGVIILNTSLKDAEDLSQELLDVIKSFSFIWDDKKFSVGASIGLVLIEGEQFNEIDLLSAADMACYAAKERGRNRIHVYSDDDADLLQRHGEMQWVAKINHALEENRFLLYKQEIQALQAPNRNINCYEYLLRLQDESGNLVYPDSFIPAAERFELMPKLDRWVIQNIFACLDLNKSDQKETNSHPLAFINLSGQVFSDDKFVDFIIAEANDKNINSGDVCFEITETSAISNINQASNFIKRLREHGFKFALDDFGTGMSSFSYLKSLQVDFLKIDGIFIKDLLLDPTNSAIVDAVTKIGHEANLKIIAEWVETSEVLDKLKSINVDYAQGYAINKPTEVLKQEALVERAHPTRSEAGAAGT